jgi:hypothetical protein
MRRWVPALGVVLVVLAAAWLASVLSSTEVTQLPLPHASARPEPSISLRSREPLPGGFVGGGFPLWILVVLGVLFGIVVLVIIGAIVWALLGSVRLSKKERLLVEPAARKLQQPAGHDEVLAALDAGLVELSDTDVDPRRAVIACWVRLEHAAAGAGTPRQVGDSPTDLVVRLLSAHRVSRPVLDRFARVYHEARYATHPIGETDRQTAIAALRQLRGELSTGVIHA